MRAVAHPGIQNQFDASPLGTVSRAATPGVNWRRETAARDDAAPTLALRLIVAFALVAAAALAFRPLSQIFSSPLTEDGFYALTVARNLASGRGSTIEGLLTNGYQPLFTWLEAGAFWIAGGDAGATRIILALHALIYAATTGFVFLLARDALDDGGAERETRGWIAAALYCGGLLTFLHHFNGLETGLVMLLYAGLLRAIQLGWLEDFGHALLIGALGGLLTLARIDGAIFVALLAARQMWAHRDHGAARAIGRAIVIALPALAISLPWWTFNLVEFGSLMPTSGVAQQAWAFDPMRWRWIGWALAVAAMPWAWIGMWDDLLPGTALRSGFLGLLVLLFAALAWRRFRDGGSARSHVRERLRRARRTGTGLCVLAATLAVLALYYGLSFVAYWFYYRYLFPAALLGVIATAWLLAPIAVRNRDFVAPIAVLLTAACLLSIVLAQQGRTLHVNTMYDEQVRLVARHVPPADLVAGGQTGTLGFFRARVLNLDGKVNREAARRQSDMPAYLDERGVRWFADWPHYVARYLGPNPAARGWVLVDREGYFELWARPAVNAAR